MLAINQSLHLQKIMEKLSVESMLIKTINAKKGYFIIMKKSFVISNIIGYRYYNKEKTEYFTIVIGDELEGSNRYRILKKDTTISIERCKEIIYDILQEKNQSQLERPDNVERFWECPGFGTYFNSYPYNLLDGKEQFKKKLELDLNLDQLEKSKKF